MKLSRESASIVPVDKEEKMINRDGETKSKIKNNI